MRTYDQDIFFRHLTGRLAARKGTPKRAALEYLLGRFGADDAWSDKRHVAYALATAAHETAYTFEPIVERGRLSYFDKYEPGTRIGKRLGNKNPGDGAMFKGRGYVQITGRGNYAKFGIEGSPLAALDPDTAFRIMTEGMFGGIFTGKKLTDYINARKTDYINARRIINGTDRAEDIAALAKIFENALVEVIQIPAQEPPVAEPPADTIGLDDLERGLDRAGVLSDKAAKVSGSSVAMTVLTKAGGWLMMALGFLNDNPVLLVAAVLLILAAVWYFRYSKDRATARLRT